MSGIKPKPDTNNSMLVWDDALQEYVSVTENELDNRLFFKVGIV